MSDHPEPGRGNSLYLCGEDQIREAMPRYPVLLAKDVHPHLAGGSPQPGNHAVYTDEEGHAVLTINQDTNRAGIHHPQTLRDTYSSGVELYLYDKYMKEQREMPSVKKTSITPWNLVEFALDARSPRSLLYGPPGTGKTMSAFLWAKEHGFTCLSTTLTEDTPMTELRGHFVLKGNEFVWHDGLIARAWRMSLTAPVLVILNEIDHASGDTSTFLHNALDDPQMARLDLPNDEVLAPNPSNLLYVATMNGVPEDLSEALRDRFPVKLQIPKPNPAAIASLPKALRTFGENLASRPGLTLRGLFEYARLVGNGASSEMSARLIFGEASTDFLNALKLAE